MPIVEISRESSLSLLPSGGAMIAGAILALLVLGSAIATGSHGGSLYARVGGMQTIHSVVDEVFDSAAGAGYAAAKAQSLKHALALRICALSGGPCKRDEDDERLPVKIGHEEFGRMVAAMRIALERRVAERERNEMLRLLAPIRRAAAVD